jgi:7-carboxy-7-deazaguanine synthase (Cx14CxxC type)
MLQARTMAYAIKEIFLTLQGEGMQAGRLAVFCRFAGCNLWSGREVDRATAVCNFCDTEFVGTDGSGGGRFADAEAVAARINDIWGDRGAQRFVVCTGGEPLLQLDPPLIEALHGLGFEIAVETNGTIAAPPGLDWICVSPKAGAPLVQTRGDELKLVVPQPALDRDALARLDFRYFLLQPMDGPDRDANARLAIALCHAEPPWRLSLQSHKMIGIL